MYMSLGIYVHHDELIVKKLKFFNNISVLPKYWKNDSNGVPYRFTLAVNPQCRN